MRKPKPRRENGEEHEGIVLQALPPERKRRSVVIAPCGCSCCCCCCLHSVGSLAGAAAGSVSAGGNPAATLYWRVLAILLGVVTLGTFLLFPPTRAGGGLLVKILLILLGLPGIQLAASFLAALVVFVSREEYYGDRKSMLLGLGRITAWSVAGTLLGIGVMWGVFAGLSR